MGKENLEEGKRTRCSGFYSFNFTLCCADSGCKDKTPVLLLAVEVKINLTTLFCLPRNKMK